MTDNRFEWEVGQRAGDFVADYTSLALPTLFERDVVFPTVQRTRALRAEQEVSDPRIPVCSVGSGRRVDCGPESLLALFYDLITTPVLGLPIRLASLSVGVFDLATGGLAPRRAFLVETPDPGALALACPSGDDFTDARFGGVVRKAASSWDLLTAFDPVFLPLDDNSALLLRNLDPVAPGTGGVSDEPLAVWSGSLSDTDTLPAVRASRSVAPGLDLSAGVLSAGGTVADFLR